MQETNNINFECLFIHFDLELSKHDIPIEQSIISEQSINTIIQELNRIIFNNQLEINIVVYPPDNGSHLKKIGISVVAVGSFIAGSMFSNVANGIIMGLGDGRNVEEYTRDGTIGIKNLVKGFLEKKNFDLVDSGVSQNNFYKAYDAKNKFYLTALKNENVKGIGFDNTDIFSIGRQDFYHRISELSIDNTDIEPIDKYHKLIVVSTINTDEDKELSWQIKDEQFKKRFNAYMKDDDFYNFYLGSNIHLKKILAKIRYFLKRNDLGEIIIERKEIIKVYEYNNEIICNLPKHASITPAPFQGFEINTELTKLNVLNPQITLFN